jgi:hypothetical protein
MPRQGHDGATTRAPTGPRARNRAKCAWHEVLRGLVRPMISKSSCFTKILFRFERFSQTTGRTDLVIYEVSVKYDGFGVVREISALLSILVFMCLKLMKT